jgi:formylglycine-generating enzyme required for sulfatase activity
MKKTLQSLVLLLAALMVPAAANAEVGDVNGNNEVTIADVSALIDYLLTGDATGINLENADCNGIDGITIADVSTLIDYLLTGNWPWVETFTVNDVSFKMIVVEGGTFTMGASDDDEDAYYNEKPAHEVTLSSYSIGETEVTQALWLAVMGSNPSRFTGDLTRPVECVDWNDCHTFISTLNQLTGKTFRLPTEAEWEFAARGGNKSMGYKFAGGNDINEVAWNRGNSSSKTHPVATKAPNELGLYDMSGNVYEWCSDWYDSYTDAEGQTDPQGPSSGSNRISRGGSWDNTAEYCRVTFRLSRWPTSLNHSLGLRLAL